MMKIRRCANNHTYSPAESYNKYILPAAYGQKYLKTGVANLLTILLLFGLLDYIFRIFIFCSVLKTLARFHWSESYMQILLYKGLR